MSRCEIRLLKLNSLGSLGIFGSALQEISMFQCNESLPNMVSAPSNSSEFILQATCSMYIKKNVPKAFAIVSIEFQLE